jgi:uncharacterized iron-regulated protein
MAESIAAVHAAAPAATPRPVIVHFNGAFHSDYTQGTAARVKRRLPRARIVVISIQPVGDLDALRPGGEARKVGEYVVYTEERK